MPPTLRRSISSPSVRVAPYSSQRRRRHADSRRVASDSTPSTRRVLAEIGWWRVMEGQRGGEEDEEVSGHSVNDDPDSDLPPQPHLSYPFDHPSPAHSRSSSGDSDDLHVPLTPLIFPRPASSSIFFPAAAAAPVSSISILAITDDPPDVGIYTPAPTPSRSSRSRATSLPKTLPISAHPSLPPLRGRDVDLHYLDLDLVSRYGLDKLKSDTPHTVMVDALGI